MPRTRLVAALLALLGVVAACGGDDSDDGAAPGTTAAGASTGFPVTIESDGGTWTLTSPPQRVVSLSPTATEILFAIGAGEQVVAVDALSTYPPEAPVTALSGYDPNVEAITSYDPDLVVLANDANDLVAGLTALDVPVFVSPPPEDIEAGYAAMADLGVATGRVDEAAARVATVREEVDAALAAAPDVPVRVYHELDETYFSASSHSFIGDVYAAMGAENIADAADTGGSGFPQLTEEYIVEADPQLIVLTDGASYGAAEVAARPGWQGVSAVRNGAIAVVDADIASRWGPRLAQFITSISDAVAAIPSATAPTS